MVPLLDDLPFFEDIDAVSVLDGGKPVSDDDGGAVPHQFIECLLNQEFGLVVNRSGGFIK